MAITSLGAFRYIGLDADIPSLGGFTSIEAGAIFDAFDTQRKYVFTGSEWLEFSGATPGDTLILNGQSTDTKPTIDIPLGSRFNENDTGRTFTFDGIIWTYESIDDESRQFNALEPRSSFVQLFGDTFGVRPAETLFLLETLNDTSPTAGTSLTNNGTIVLTREEDDLPLRGFLVPSLNGVDQFFSLPTENKVEVGIGGFVANIQFKKTSVSAFETVFHYGDNTASQKWELSYDDSGNISCTINDGTNPPATATDTIPNRTVDGNLHTATMLVDRTPTVNLMSLIIDGETVATADISGVLLTLNAVGVDLTIGAAVNVGAADLFFSGQLSNFSLYQADSADASVPPDYNIPGLIHAGIRESATVGKPALSNDNSLRLNNEFESSITAGDYSIVIINTSEGFYEIIQIEKTGTEKISIDGNEITDLTSVFLSAGTHILKYENALSAVLEFACLELIKRDGTDQGDDEATSGVLFGDELQEQITGSNWELDVDTGKPYNNIIGNQVTPLTINDSIQGTTFNKKGLYNVTLGYEILSGAANIDLFAGGVKILDAFDMSVGTPSEVATQTVSAFLEGGITEWKLVVNSAGSVGASTLVKIWAIRYELVTGKSNGDVVNIWAADDDFQIVSGVDFLLTIQTGSRFNALRQQDTATHALNDEFLWNRYFSGGTYKVKLLHSTNASGGVVDFFIDGDSANPFLANVRMQNGNVDSLENFATVTIPRGFHDVHAKVVADGNINDFNILLARLQFTKIATVINAENDDNSDPVHGALVPLAKHVGVQAESSILFNLSPIDLVNNYSEIIVKVGSSVTASLELRMILNGLEAGNYHQDGSSNISGTGLVVNIGSASFLQLLGTNILAGANVDFFAKATIELMTQTPSRIGGVITGRDVTLGEQTTLYGVVGGSPIFSVEIRTSTSTLETGTRIEIYGVLK